MNWFKKQAAVIDKPAATKVQEERLGVPARRNKAHEPDMSAEERAEYIRVAEAVGIGDSPAVIAERLLAFMQEENITTYDRQKVYEYLNQELGKGKWEWRGVRKSDVAEFSGWISHYDGGDVMYGAIAYTEKIPLPVLLTIQKVAEAVPGAHFYISELASSKVGDPFLMVSGRGIGSYIIERWDEPRFRG